MNIVRNWYLKYKVCIRRSVRTFVQAAVGVFVTGITSGEFDLSEWKTWVLTLGGSALAAGVAAVMNRGNKKEAKA